MLINTQSQKAEEAANERRLSKDTQAPPPSYESTRAVSNNAPVPFEEGPSEPRPGPSASTSAPEVTLDSSDKPLKDAAQRLQLAIEEYRAAQEGMRGGGNDEATKRLIREQEEAIVRKLRDVGDNSTDHHVREYYHRTAELLVKATPEKKDGIVNDVGRGLKMIIAAPIALTAASIGAVADILAGLGYLTKGVTRTIAEAANSKRRMRRGCGARR
ncbi:hypothetical protein V5O48_001326 [Marasmius crinis-equi]|uniref:Uncharacterized protein n=1 Tax=Marasmius crinis-equi TaxID=585013 RepID=A0ABR3FYS6_9AGAR